MSNPYQAPVSEVSRKSAYGPIDFETSFKQAWEALKAALWPLIASTLVLGVAMTGAVALLVVGWIFLLPALSWGAYRFYLNVFDGQGEIGDLLVGFQEDYLKRTARMGVLILAMVVLGVLTNAVYYIGLFTEDEPLMVVGFLLQMACQYLLINRFGLAGFFVVDKDMPAMEALAASWQSTSRQWLLYVAVAFLAILIQVIGLLACCVGILVSVPFGYLMFVSVYRQVTLSSDSTEDVDAGDSPAASGP